MKTIATPMDLYLTTEAFAYLAARQRDADRIAELEAENNRLHEEVRKLMEGTHRTFLYDGPMPSTAPTGTPTEGT